MFEQLALCGRAELLAGGPNVLCRISVPRTAAIIPTGSEIPKHVRFEWKLRGRIIPYLIVGDGVNELTKPNRLKKLVGALRVYKCNDGSRDRLVVVIDRKICISETHKLVLHSNYRHCRGDVRQIATAKVDGHNALLEIRSIIGFKQHLRLKRQRAAAA